MNLIRKSDGHIRCGKFSYDDGPPVKCPVCDHLFSLRKPIGQRKSPLRCPNAICQAYLCEEDLKGAP